MLHNIYKFSNFQILKLFVIVFLLSCSPKYSLNTVQVSSYNIKDSIQADSATMAEISPYKNELDKTMNEVLNISETSMIKGEPEGLLGNFVADLILKKTKSYYFPNDGTGAQICLLNNGGLRTSLPKGEITRGKIFELMPFENELTVLTLSGNNVKQIFEYLAKSGGAPVSGIKMGIENVLPVNIFVNSEPFDSTKVYKVVTSDYLANGGDKYGFFKNPLNREDLGIKVRDVIIEYIAEENKEGKTLNSQLDGRIYYVR